MYEVCHPRVQRVGENAVLLECGDLSRAMRVFERLRRARERGALLVDELVPAAETVLVRWERRDMRSLDALFSELDRTDCEESSRTQEHSETVIPVVYNGRDLSEVERLSGLSREQIAARHVAAEYRVAFSGFSPGFAYLVGLDPALVLPRKRTPRARVPTGSVGLAGEFTGVYPNASPGGWQLIGHTDCAMWDLERDPPSLLSPGDRVRFVASRERVVLSRENASPGNAVRTRTPQLQPGASPALLVVSPGLQSLIQDRGRPGFSSIGVGPSGVSDRGAMKLGNRLVGNDAHAAVLELGPGGFSAIALGTGVLALTGAIREAQVDGPLGTRTIEHGRAFRIDPEERLRLADPIRGTRTLLSVRGGISSPIVLGSASRDTLSGIGPDALKAGDLLYSGDLFGAAVGFPESTARALPARGERTVLGVLPGPRRNWLTPESLERFWTTEWEVSPRSDRVGARLSGEQLVRAEEFRERELPSEGLVTGAIQIPPDGQPVIFLSDRPVTGGYPVIGVISERDLDLAAQLPPGALVRFEPSEAQCAASFPLGSES